MYNQAPQTELCTHVEASALWQPAREEIIMKRRILAVLAGISTLVAMGLTTAASAGASGHRQATRAAAGRLAAGFPDGVLCDLESTPLCMNGFDGSGGLIKGFHYTPGDAQDVAVTQDTTICGPKGEVTADCPFKPGLNLNNLNIGEPIVYINNYTNGKLYYADSSGNLREGSVGDDFVLSGNLTGTDPESDLIDVQASNALSISNEWDEACTTGLGNPIVVKFHSPTDARCIWSKHSS
jgi:hypothetical protein